MCVCAWVTSSVGVPIYVWVPYSISSTGLSVPIGHQPCVSYTLRQWRTPWILIHEVLASVECVYVCVFGSVHLYACSPHRECGVTECRDWSKYVCIWLWQCALWGHYDCVCVCAHVCSMDRSEVNQYWQWIISSDMVAGGFDGADLTQQQEKKIHVPPPPPICYSHVILFLTSIQVRPWARH